jgi:hypothetical protein
MRIRELQDESSSRRSCAEMCGQGGDGGQGGEDSLGQESACEKGGRSSASTSRRGNCRKDGMTLPNTSDVIPKPIIVVLLALPTSFSIIIIILV